MRRYVLWCILALLGQALVVPRGSLAQEGARVSGQVVDAVARRPLAGVQVQVKGTTIGTVTDRDGRYSIRVPAGRSELNFTFLGYRSVDLPITGSQVNAALELEAIGLEGVVVTALGITREKRDLGYAAQRVGGESITNVPQVNLVSALTGKVAGVNVTSATTPGGSARIIIRGNKSIAGNNEPLFVVDGVPISNVNYGASYFDGSTDRGSAVADLDPHNIESITVLKGPNAAALYGSLAANGAVVITTKSGLTDRGVGLSASIGTTFETPLRLPRYQNLYGQGFGGEFSYVDGRGGGLNDDAAASWGPRLDGRPIDQFTGKQQPWVARPNNVRDFFELGRSTFVNAAVSHASENTNLRLSVSNTRVNSMAPGNTINTTNISFRGGADLNERLSAGASISYVHRDAKNRPVIGYSTDNFMDQFIWFGRQVDMKALRRYQTEAGGQFNWSSTFHDNPYWIQYVNGNEDNRDRIFGGVDLSYKLTDWTTLTLRAGQDQIQNFVKSRWAIGSMEFPDGAFSQGLDRLVERNYDALISASREVTPKLLLLATAGGSIRTSEYRDASVFVGKLNAPGIYSLKNAGEIPDATEDYSRKQVNSLMGTLSLNYRGYLSAEATARNDWSSTLPAANRSYFYPSLSMAFVFTDAFEVGGSVLTSGKLRGSWARVGNDTEPYRLYPTYIARDPFRSLPAFSAPSVLLNSNLKPEQVTSVEFGADLGLFDERLGFVVTYYDVKTENQILRVEAPASSGAIAQNINAGAVRNRGIEIQLEATPVRSANGFQWDLSLNFDKNRNEVVELYTDPGSGERVPAVVMTSLPWGVELQARVGAPFGAFYGAPFERDEATGKLLVNAAGVPMADWANRRVLGDINPDWSAGLRNTFRYKNFDLSALIDGRLGGQIYSSTIGFGRMAGVLEETVQGREIDHCDPGIVIDGIYRPNTTINGVDVSGQKNESAVCPEYYYGDIFGIAESWIFDASFMKLRELKLGYRVPQGFANRLGVSNMSVSLVGRNLWLWSKVPHIDPETTYTTGNEQGLEYGQFPSARSFGLTISVQP